MGSLTLRPYQASAIQSLRLCLAGGFKRVMLYSPTGSGKTECAMAIIHGAIAKGKRVTFLCNRITSSIKPRAGSTVRTSRTE